MDPTECEQLSLQGPEAYYYLNQVGPRRSEPWLSGHCGIPGIVPPQACCSLQGRACRLQGKEDAQDFKELVKALRVLGLCADELTAIWAVLATILHLGNICFSSSEVGSLVGGTTEHTGWMGVFCTIGAVMTLSHCVWRITKPWAASESRLAPNA